MSMIVYSITLSQAHYAVAIRSDVSSRAVRCRLKRIPFMYVRVTNQSCLPHVHNDSLYELLLVLYQLSLLAAPAA